MYAIVRTGGKQYRVERGQSLLVERLPADDGATVTLDPLLYVDGAEVVDGDELAKVKVSARVVGHERGPKLRVVKFKPKRGYKRRNGHRQELTRLEVTEIKLGARRARAAAEPAAGEPDAAPRGSDAAAPKPARRARTTPAAVEQAAAPQPTRRPRTPKADEPETPARTTPKRPRSKPTPKETGDGS